MEAESMIPLWAKLAYTLFVLITVAVTSVKYPLGNFLWFSDIALLSHPQKRIPRLAYLRLLMIGFPVLIYLPTHLLLQALFA